MKTITNYLPSFLLSAGCHYATTRKKLSVVPAKILLTVIVASALAGCFGANNSIFGSSDKFFVRVSDKVDEDRVEKNIASLSEQIPMSNDLVSLYIMRGYNFALIEQYDDAMRDFDAALFRSPGSSAALVNRGIVHEATGNPHLARLDFERAAELDGDLAHVAYEKIGVLEMSDGNLSAAERFFTKSLSIRASHAAYHYRAVLKLSQSDYEGAILDFTSAINFDPNSAESYAGRGVTYAEQDKLVLAEFDLTNAVLLHPSFPVVWNNYGEVKLALKKYAEAEVAFKSALIYDRKFIAAKENLNKLRALGHPVS